MKKKFVLTLALVLMVAAAVVAAPLEVSGSFKGGYKFTFEDDGDKSIAKAGDQASINAVAAFTGDFWKLSLAGGAVTFDNDMQATLEVYLDKALAEQGVDMGDVSLKYAIGNKVNLSPSDVYGDSNDAVNELAMLGKSYSALVTLGYADLVTVEFGADPTDATNKPIMAGVKVMPVDGVSAAFGYTNYAKIGDDKNAAGTVDYADKVSSKGGITGSVMVDAAALADLDFGLSVSAIDVYYMEYDTVVVGIPGGTAVPSGDAINNLYVEAKASLEDVTAWVEYQNLDKTNNVITKVSYSGIENMGVYAKLTLNDLSDVTTKIGAGADYSMGGVKYALDAEYTLDGDFTLTPSVSVSF